VDKISKEVLAEVDEDRQMMKIIQQRQHQMKGRPKGVRRRMQIGKRWLCGFEVKR